MIYIVVDDDQARLIAESSQGVEIRDKQGKHLGFVAHGFSNQDIALAKDRIASTQERFTTQEVLDYLQNLEVK
jgi:hypothetical protein